MKTKHHLFSLAEIRLRLKEIMGEPKTEAEQQALREKAKRIYTSMPVFKLRECKHTSLHWRLRRQEKMITLLRKSKYNFRTLRHLLVQKSPKPLPEVSRGDVDPLKHDKEQAD